jgi:hypothetical protein
MSSLFSLTILMVLLSSSLSRLPPPPPPLPSSSLLSLVLFTMGLLTYHDTLEVSCRLVFFHVSYFSVLRFMHLRPRCWLEILVSVFRQ